MGFDLSLVIDVIMNNSDDTIYFKDKESKFLLNSVAHAKQFGLTNPKELVGKSDFDFFPEKFANEAYLDEKRIMDTGIPIIGKVEKWEGEDGNTVWLSASKYPFYDREGNIIGTWGTSRDITPLKQAEQELQIVNQQLEKANLQLKEQSKIDGLSKLYNHRHFCETLEHTIIYYLKQNELEHETFCVMMLDIDSFKLINDTYGHLVGDIAIKHIADLITANTRNNDICFRCGGDEFAVILLDTSLEQGLVLAERIRHVIEESHFMAKDIDLKLTVSVGISSFEGEQDMDSLIQKVDNKLYISKRMGRNQVN